MGTNAGKRGTSGTYGPIPKVAKPGGMTQKNKAVVPSKNAGRDLCGPGTGAMGGKHG